MGLVAAKCTQCGANIEVDDTNEAGICRFCGTAFITEKAITNYNTYVTNNNNFAGATINVNNGDVNNLLLLARNADKAGNMKEANSYYTRVLEIQPFNKEALIGKGYTACIQNSIVHADSDELLSYANEALKESVDNDFLLDVYEKLNKVALALFGGTESFYRENWKHAEAVDVLINGLEASCNIGKYMKTDIEARGLNANKVFSTVYQGALINICMCCCELCKQREYVDSVQTSGYFTWENKGKIKINSQKHEYYLREYDKVMSILKEIGYEDYSQLPTINRKTENQGCYIATCVYGSYDCPQVWTLRRFRDYTLDATWYGRIFINCYYAISPKLVKYFGHTKWFKQFWKCMLDKLVSNLNVHGVDNTYYHDKY